MLPRRLRPSLLTATKLHSRALSTAKILKFRVGSLPSARPRRSSSLETCSPTRSLRLDEHSGTSKTGVDLEYLRTVTARRFDRLLRHAESAVSDVLRRAAGARPPATGAPAFRRQSLGHVPGGYRFVPALALHERDADGGRMREGQRKVRRKGLMKEALTFPCFRAHWLDSFLITGGTYRHGRRSDA